MHLFDLCRSFDRGSRTVHEVHVEYLTQTINIIVLLWQSNLTTKRLSGCRLLCDFIPFISVRRRSSRTFSTHFEIFRRRVGMNFQSVLSMLFLFSFKSSC